MMANAPRSDTSALGAAVHCQCQQDQEGEQQDPHAEARGRGSRQQRTAQEASPYARQEESPAYMCIPLSLRICERRTLDRQREVPPNAVQRARDKGEIHRLRADMGQRGVHHTHRQTERRDADPTG